MYENTGGALPEGSLDSKSTMSCTQIELAIWSTRSTKPRSKIILGTIERFERLRGNLWQHRGSQNLWSTSFRSRATEYNTREQSQEVDREVREPQTLRIILQDLSQTQKINKFSKESQDLITDMNNTEIFELCENSSKQQCPECNTFWDIGIIYCSSGRNMKSPQSSTGFEQNNNDDTSIPGYSSRGAKHGPSERQKMYYQAKQMLKKARQKKHGRHPTNDNDGMLVYCLLLFMTMIFRTSTRDGMKFHYECQRFHPIISWKVCTN